MEPGLDAAPSAGDTPVKRSIFAPVLRILDAPLELILPTQNPLLMRNLRSKMRGGRFYFFLIAYQIALVVVLTIVGLITFSQQVVTYMGSVEAAEIGRTLFLSMVFAQGALLYLFAPLTTANFLSGEREHRSLELLQLTVLRNVSIVSGELLGTLCYVLLLTIASMPIASLFLMIGGVSVTDILIAEAALVLLSFYGLALGIFCSAVFKKRIVALLASIFFMAGTCLSLIFLGNADAAFLAAWSPLASIPNFIEVTWDINYFGVSTPIWIPAFANSAILTVLLLMIAARVTRDEERARLGIPTLVVALSLICGHIAGGLWSETDKTAGPVYEMLVLFLAIVLMALAMGRFRQGRGNLRWIRGGESPLGFLCCLMVVAPATYMYAVWRDPSGKGVIPPGAADSWLSFILVASACLFFFWSFGRLIQQVHFRRLPPSRAILILGALLCAALPAVIFMYFEPVRETPLANRFTSVLLAVSPTILPFMANLATFPGVWVRAALQWVPHVPYLKSPLLLPFALYLGAGFLCLILEAIARKRQERKVSEAASIGSPGPSLTLSES